TLSAELFDELKNGWKSDNYWYQFYIGVTALKKSVDRLIIQMQRRETYCMEKHKEIGEHFSRHDAGMDEMRVSLGDHVQRISKVEGNYLNKKP
ncbi:MAG: hypothetical protein WCP32_12560, partial [Bacteroidota bacterium]